VKALKKALILILLLCALADSWQVLAEGKDQTILLDESLIQGSSLLNGQAFGGRRRRVEGPALSTAFRWDGEKIEALDIPKEILDELTPPDLPFTLREKAESDEFADGLEGERE